MMNLAEYRNRSATLADHLPWAALVASGVVLNKDGSFQRTARFRGPDLESATPAELIGTGAAAATRHVSRTASGASGAMAENYRGGARTAVEATGGSSTMGTTSGQAAGDATQSTSTPPAWAQRMKRHQTMSPGATAAAHAVRSGDSHGGGASISLRQDER